MKRFNLLLGLLLSVWIAWGGERAGAQTTGFKAPARTFVETLAREDFDGAVKSFGPPIKSSLTPKELRDTWKSIVAKRGAFKRIVSVEDGKVEEYGSKKYEVVLVKCQFAQSDYVVRVSYNSEGQITSLWFVPAKSKA